MGWYPWTENNYKLLIIPVWPLIAISLGQTPYLNNCFYSIWTNDPQEPSLLLWKQAQICIRETVKSNCSNQRGFILKWQSVFWGKLTFSSIVRLIFCEDYMGNKNICQTQSSIISTKNHKGKPYQDMSVLNDWNTWHLECLWSKPVQSKV